MILSSRGLRETLAHDSCDDLADLSQSGAQHPSSELCVAPWPGMSPVSPETGYDTGPIFEGHALEPSRWVNDCFFAIEFFLF